MTARAFDKAAYGKTRLRGQLYQRPPMNKRGLWRSACEEAGIRELSETRLHIAKTLVEKSPQGHS